MELDNTRMKKVATYTAVTACTLVLALGIWSIYFDSQSQITTTIDLPKKVSWELIPMEKEPLRGPMPTRLSEMGIISLEEAQKKVRQFRIKVPDEGALPPKFSVRGAIYQLGGPSVFRGERYTVETVELFLLDKPLPMDKTPYELGSSGALFVRMMYTRCTGTLDLYKEVYRNTNATVEFLWGHEAAYGDRFAVLCNEDEDMVYSVHGRYRSEALLGVMKSLLEK